MAVGNKKLTNFARSAAHFGPAQQLGTQAYNSRLLACGPATAVREFIELAFGEVGRRIEWQGRGIDERGIDAATGKDLVRVDSRYFRPTEVEELVGDASKAAARLGWQHTASFKDLVAEMVRSDLQALAQQPSRKDPGHY